MKTILTCLAVVVLLLATDRVQSQQRDDLKRRFLREAPLKWEEYLTTAQKIQGSCKVYSTELEPKKREGVRFDKVKQNKTAAILIWAASELNETAAGALGDYVYGANSLYSFVLTRQKTGKPWTLSQYEEDRTKRFDRSVAPFEKWC